jgi:hypothetical protein
MMVPPMIVGWAGQTNLCPNLTTYMMGCGVRGGVSMAQKSRQLYPEEGQVWESSDPRRMRKVRVDRIDYDTEQVYVTVLYPVWLNPKQMVPLSQFLHSGSKGMTRVE